MSLSKNSQLSAIQKEGEKVFGVSFLLLFSVVPLGAGVLYALLYSIGVIGALNKGFTLYHWQVVFSEGVFMDALLCSISVAVVVVFLSTVLALFFGITAAKNEYLTIRYFYLPLSIPPVIAAFISFQYLSNSGVLARLCHALGLINKPEDFGPLVNDSGYFGVVFTQVLLMFPLITLLVLNYYRTAQLAALSQAASVLGAGSGQIYQRVVIPVLLQKMRPNLVLCFIVAMSAYEIPLLLGRQSPMMLSVLIGQKFNKFNLADIPQAYAMTVMYACFTMILVVLFIRTKHTAL